MSSETIDASQLPLDKCSDPKVLDPLLSLLFEPTPSLHNVLVPGVLDRLSSTAMPSTYSQLIDTCSDVASQWTWEDKAGFIAGHPMIGAPKVSGLSGKEQGSGPVTPQVVIDRYGSQHEIMAYTRLQHLNTLYCKIYPDLRYITFVNGRPRQAIVNEMEEALGVTVSPQPLPDDYPVAEPALDSEEVRTKVKSKDSAEWKTECDRGLADVWLIGKSRLKTLSLV